MRLICIGDSLTFGYGVHLSQRWTQLCAQETGWELVNEGINGDTTGGMLARINRKRGTGKGRAASVSLPLAIVLLMTAGSLNVFLGTLTDVVTGGEMAGEVGVMAQLDAETPQDAGTVDGNCLLYTSPSPRD